MIIHKRQSVHRLDTSRLTASVILAIAFMNVPITVSAHTFKKSQGYDVEPAKPLSQVAPTFPATCMSQMENNAAPVSVKIGFDISARGQTENVTVLSSDDPCFNEAAISAVAGWRYAPQKIKGKPVQQPEMSVRFSFDLKVTDQSANMLVHDTVPIYRIPPKYPERCASFADDREHVILGFDVSAEGVPVNTRVIETTSKCFNKAALASITQWKYEPKLVEGVPTLRKNLEQRISFRLASPGEKVYEVRRPVILGVKRIGRNLRKGSLEKASEGIEKLMSKYGDSLSQSERGLIYQMRGSLYLRQKEYSKALDDFRFARAHSIIDGEARIAIGETIAKLERHLNIIPGAVIDAPTENGNSESEQP